MASFWAPGTSKIVLPLLAGAPGPKKRPFWDPKNLLKMTKRRKKNFGTRFSIAKRRKIMTRDLSWAPKADFVKILLPLLAAAGFSRLRRGPKLVKTDPFEMKNAQPTSNGTVLRVLKKFFVFLKRH